MVSLLRCPYLEPFCTCKQALKPLPTVIQIFDVPKCFLIFFYSTDLNVLFLSNLNTVIQSLLSIFWVIEVVVIGLCLNLNYRLNLPFRVEEVPYILVYKTRNFVTKSEPYFYNST